MKKRSLAPLAAASLLLTAFTPACLARGEQNARGNDSIYTELSGESCKAVEPEEEYGSAHLLCPGVGGFQLAVLDDDDRMSIDILTPAGEERSLNYWSVVTQGFSTLGQKAEWRIDRGGQPLALIVRVNASEDPADSSKITSYLSVAKITSSEICVTARIEPAAQANKRAREAADRAAHEPCLQAP